MGTSTSKLSRLHLIVELVPAEELLDAGPDLLDADDIGPDLLDPGADNALLDTPLAERSAVPPAFGLIIVKASIITPLARCCI